MLARRGETGEAASDGIGRNRTESDGVGRKQLPNSHAANSTAAAALSCPSGATARPLNRGNRYDRIATG